MFGMSPLDTLLIAGTVLFLCVMPIAMGVWIALKMRDRDTDADAGTPSS